MLSAAKDNTGNKGAVSSSGLSASGARVNNEGEAGGDSGLSASCSFSSVLVNHWLFSYMYMYMYNKQ